MLVLRSSFLHILLIITSGIFCSFLLHSFLLLSDLLSSFLALINFLDFKSHISSKESFILYHCRIMSAVALAQLATGCFVWRLGRGKNPPIFFFSVPKVCFLFSLAVSSLSIKTSFTLYYVSLAIKMASSTKEDMSLIVCSFVALILWHNSVSFFYFCEKRHLRDLILYCERAFSQYHVFQYWGCQCCNRILHHLICLRRFDPQSKWPTEKAKERNVGQEFYE